MKCRWVLLAVAFCLAVGLGGAWISGGLAGKPTLSVSGPGGTSRILPATESAVAEAITNAFDLFKYHDMMLTDPIGEDWMARDWHPTNGFLLVPTVSTIATVPTKGLLGIRHLPYVATFHITLKLEGTNQTQVNVRTVTAKVLDGIGLGHGGSVANTANVPAVREEETNIIKAIEAEIKSGKRSGGLWKD